ncbi:MAG: histidine kinase [Lachnospiraceae bacterium]|nr:histidine kinase [Lachnospiraceae bacterium]
MQNYFLNYISHNFINIIIILGICTTLISYNRLHIPINMTSRTGWITLLLFLLTIIDNTRIIMNMRNGNPDILEFLNALKSSIAPILILMQLYLVLPDTKAPKYLFITALFNALLCFLTANNTFYTFISTNPYFKWVLLLRRSLPYIISLVYLILMIYYSSKYIKTKTNYYSYLLIFFAISIFLTSILEYFDLIENVSNTVIGINILLYNLSFIITHQLQLQDELTKQTLKLAEANKELSENKLKLLMAQIHPHFIFNSLLAIKSLCKRDPKVAAECVQNFSDYLRANFEVLTTDELIPLEIEIEHIKQYLSLEMVDPKSNFTVEWDLKVSNFEVPALSVEPLVENAVRHGISTRNNDGIIIISTALEDNNYIISIKDNGNPKNQITPQQLERKSIGLKNVQMRLSSLCDGKVDILTNDSGTTAKIYIPNPEAEN